MGGGFPETIFDNFVVDNDDKDNELSWSLEVGPAAKSNKREATWSDEGDNGYDLYHDATLLFMAREVLPAPPNPVVTMPILRVLVIMMLSWPPTPHIKMDDIIKSDLPPLAYGLPQTPLGHTLKALTIAISSLLPREMVLNDET